MSTTTKITTYIKRVLFKNPFYEYIFFFSTFIERFLGINKIILGILTVLLGIFWLLYIEPIGLIFPSVFQNFDFFEIHFFNTILLFIATNIGISIYLEKKGFKNISETIILFSFLLLFTTYSIILFELLRYKIW